MCVERIWRKSILILRILSYFWMDKGSFPSILNRSSLWYGFIYMRHSQNFVKKGTQAMTSSWHLSGILNVLSFDKICSLDWKWLPHITFYRKEKFLAFQRSFFRSLIKATFFQKTLFLLSWGSYKTSHF